MSERPIITLAEDLDEQPQSADQDIPDPDAILEKLGITKTSSKVGFFGGGQAGFKIAERLFGILDPDVHLFTRIIAVNTDSKPFDKMIRARGEERPKYLNAWLNLIGERFDLIQLGKDGTGAGGEIEFSAKAFLDKLPRIQKDIEGLKALFMFNGMGGGTGTQVSVEGAKITEEKKGEMAVFSILIFPFEFEEAERLSRAAQGRKETADHVCIITIYNQSIFIRVKNRDDEKRDINDDIEGVNENIIVPLLNTIKQLTLKTASTINRDLSDLRKIAEGKEAYIVSTVLSAASEEGNSTKEESLERAFSRLLHDPAQDWGIVNRSNRGIIIFEGSFSKEEVKKVTDLITGAMREGHPETPISLTPGFDRNSSQKALYFICSSPVFKGPKTEWTRPEEKKKQEQVTVWRAEETEECERMQISDLMGLHKKRIKVSLGGNNELIVYVSENFAKLWEYFWREQDKWPMEKRREKWGLIQTYLAGHEDHVEPLPPPDLKPANGEFALAPGEDALKKCLIGQMPSKKEEKKKRSWFKK